VIILQLEKSRYGQKMKSVGKTSGKSFVHSKLQHDVEVVVCVGTLGVLVMGSR
jgi:hypothetical protein